MLSAMRNHPVTRIYNSPRQAAYSWSCEDRTVTGQVHSAMLIRLLETDADKAVLTDKGRTPRQR